MAVLLLALAWPAAGQEPEHLGPVPTRDQFPPNLFALSYQPVPPDVLPAGSWEGDLQCVEANTLEFSDIIKANLPAAPTQRMSLTRDWAQGIANQYPEFPVIFLFQMETTLTTLRLRRGLGGGTEAWVQVPCLGYSGGFEDGLIEAVHKLGFEQSGRTAIAKDQVRVVVIQKGQLLYYSNESSGPKLEDPVLGVTQRLAGTPACVLAASLEVKPALRTSMDDIHSGWDTALQLTGRWSPSSSLDVYFGVGGVHRESGSLTFNRFGFRDQLGAHLMVEAAGNRVWRPFLQLYYLTGSTYSMAGQKMNLPSLQHDLGVHWMIAPGRVLTFRYLNNITNNENTADMALVLEFTWRFASAS